MERTWGQPSGRSSSAERAGAGGREGGRGRFGLTGPGPDREDLQANQPPRYARHSRNKRKQKTPRHRFLHDQTLHRASPRVGVAEGWGWTDPADPLPPARVSTSTTAVCPMRKGRTGSSRGRSMRTGKRCGRRTQLMVGATSGNNAGFGNYASFHLAEPTRLSEMLQVNVVALTELTRVFLPGMVARRRGQVLLVGATAGFAPGPGAAVYHATKAYVLSLGEALAYELRGSGVTLTTLCPGATRTGFATAANGEATKLYDDHASVMESAVVARLAYQALKRGRRVLVPGLSNKLGVAFSRFVPRSMGPASLADLHAA